MSEKVMIVLDGISAGKTTFIETIKVRGSFWTWNVNPGNVLSMLAHKLSWTGQRDKNYYDWLEKEFINANEHFNFEHNYIFGMADKFLNDDRPQVLIIHNIDEVMAKELMEVYVDKCYTVLISDSEVPDDTYCKTLNYKSETYVDDILNMMNILTKSFSNDTKKEIE